MSSMKKHSFNISKNRMQKIIKEELDQLLNEISPTADQPRTKEQRGSAKIPISMISMFKDWWEKTTGQRGTGVYVPSGAPGNLYGPSYHRKTGWDDPAMKRSETARSYVDTGAGGSGAGGVAGARAAPGYKPPPPSIRPADPRIPTSTAAQPAPQAIKDTLEDRPGYDATAAAIEAAVMLATMRLPVGGLTKRAISPSGMKTLKKGTGLVKGRPMPLYTQDPVHAAALEKAATELATHLGTSTDEVIAGFLSDPYNKIYDELTLSIPRLQPRAGPLRSKPIPHDPKGTAGTKAAREAELRRWHLRQKMIGPELDASGVPIISTPIQQRIAKTVGIPSRTESPRVIRNINRKGKHYSEVTDDPISGGDLGRPGRSGHLGVRAHSRDFDLVGSHSADPYFLTGTPGPTGPMRALPAFARKLIKKLGRHQFIRIPGKGGMPDKILNRIMTPTGPGGSERVVHAGWMTPNAYNDLRKALKLLGGAKGPGLAIKDMAVLLPDGSIIGGRLSGFKPLRGPQHGPRSKPAPIRESLEEETQRFLQENLWQNIQDTLGIPTYSLGDALNKPRWVNKHTGETLSDMEYIQKYAEWYRKKELGLDPRLQGNRRRADTGEIGFGREYPVRHKPNRKGWNPRPVETFYPPE